MTSRRHQLEIRERRLVLDGEPRILMAGEIHYFRVPRQDWGDRIDDLVRAGATMVATYIPWMWHELPDGTLDLTGATRPERDVGAFLDLCAEKGMTVLARPGPFVMAELLGEGIPARVAREHPEVVGTGWDGVPTPSQALDYLAPAFLAEARRWYEAVLPVLAARRLDAGGPVAVVQLDNEIGMLAWVTNSPDLTPSALDGLRTWVLEHRTDARSVYPLDDPNAWSAAVRSPDESWAAPLRVDLGHYTRERYATYVATLRAWADELGLSGTAYLVNVHGTEAGGGEPFGIGISQLYRSFAGVPGMLSGSDHYLGPMSLDKAIDVTLINLQLSAVNDADQPLCSVEFEAGTGDYGGGGEESYGPETVDLKTRLFVAQGNRLLNYYLFAGGENPVLDEPVGDGADRIAFTGQRHGTAAPVSPDGSLGPEYEPTARAIRVVTVYEPWLARMLPETDDLDLGVVLDSYLTEYVHPRSAVMTEIAGGLRLGRGAGPRRALLRGLLRRGYQPGSVHLEAADPRPGSCVLLATSPYLDEAVQSRLVRHLESGGRLLTLGRLPEWDTEGRPCRMLADALGLTPLAVDRDGPRHFPTVVAHGVASPWPQTRVGWMEPVRHERGDMVLGDLAGRPVGVAVTVGAGRVVHLGADVPGDPDLFDRLLGWLEVRQVLRLESDVPGVMGMTTVDGDDRILHLLNLTGYVAEVATRVGELTTDLRLPGRTGVMLPLGLPVPQGRIVWASAELTGWGEDHLSFGPGVGLDGTTVHLRGQRPLDVPEVDVRAVEDGWLVHADGRPLTLSF